MKKEAFLDFGKIISGVKIWTYIPIFHINLNKIVRKTVYCNKKLKKLIQNHPDLLKKQRKFSRHCTFLYMSDTVSYRVFSNPVQ
jgi:hypothetical protein